MYSSVVNLHEEICHAANRVDELEQKQKKILKALEDINILLSHYKHKESTYRAALSLEMVRI
jgi:hypothetical protein